MIEVRALCKRFGSLEVTSDVTLALESGERRGLIGPNGAGKTTLFNLLTGELQPDSGSIWLAGKNVTRSSPDARVRAGLGRSFQRNNLFPALTVEQNLAVACALQQGAHRAFWRSFAGLRRVHSAARAMAERLGLEHELDTRASNLSYGTQRQVEIGLALALEPKVLLLDEPTSGMSPEETAAMQRLITSLPAELTLLIVEHDMDVLFDIANTVTVLDFGRVLAQGTPAQIRASETVRIRYLGGHA
ncbi:MAG: ABC transporter ATP-binding protein [Gammaproteobacteria bacterium]